MPSADSDFYRSKEWREFRARMLNELDHVCVACGDEPTGFDLTLDHIIPRSKRPDLALEPTNVQVMCRTCNGTKQDRLQVRHSLFNDQWIEPIRL